MTVHRMVFWMELAKNRYDVFETMAGFNHDLPGDSPQNDPY